MRQLEPRPRKRVGKLLGMFKEATKIFSSMGSTRRNAVVSIDGAIFFDLS
jgi:hypothetical protein